MDRKPLGKKIRSARKDKGLTGEKLAEACCINSSYLRQLESGVKTPSLPLFISLCNHLEVSPSYLLADYISATEDTDILIEFCRKATPSQTRMITSMLKSALESMQE